jgi:hypothetical protein
MMAILQACITGVLAAFVIGLLVSNVRSTRRPKQVEDNSSEELEQSYQRFGEALSEFSKAVDAIDRVVSNPRTDRDRTRISHGVYQYRILLQALSKAGMEGKGRSRYFVPSKALHGALEDTSPSVAQFSCLFHALRKKEDSIEMVNPQLHTTLVKREYGGPEALAYNRDLHVAPADWYDAIHTRRNETASKRVTSLGRTKVGGRPLQRQLTVS